MTHVLIYTKAFCGYCYAAKKLLTRKGVVFEEFDVTFDAEKRQEMYEKVPGSRTVPQIFIGGLHVGGSDELQALERKGELDALLARAAGMAP